MAVYSINDLEKISGIKAHTIRIWERRYSLIKPDRTSTNIRLYDDEDLKKILNVSILNQNGLKISKIAKLSCEQLKEMVIDLCLDAKNSDVQIESLLVAMLELDEGKFNSVLHNLTVTRGFESVIETVIFPFLERIGILWQAGTVNPAQEHFISNLIRQKLIVSIDHQMQASRPESDKCIVFFLPENEMHELGLLFYSLIARKKGLKVLYLGAMVPVKDIKLIVEVSKADALFTSFVTAEKKEDVESLITDIVNNAGDIPVYVTGLQIKELNPGLPKNCRSVSGKDDFIELLEKL